MDFAKLKNIIFPSKSDKPKQKKIRLYTSCDELILHNFNQIKKGKYEYLIWGYDGFSEVELPENYMEVWQDILHEYELKTNNSQLTSYYELIVDTGKMKARHASALFSLTLLESSMYFDEDRLKELSEDIKANKEGLRGLRFYINDSKPLIDELKAKKRQLNEVQMKINQKEKERELIESKNTEGSSFEDTKQLVFLNTGRLIDEYKMTVSGYISFLNMISKNKSAVA